MSRLPWLGLLIRHLAVLAWLFVVGAKDEWWSLRAELRAHWRVRPWA